MVQKHDASRLHWDFRLEIDGVLKSWAVTRGPASTRTRSASPSAPRTIRFPMPIFEGTIPKGQYGGGTVMLWDRGTWSPIKGKSAKDLDKGHLHFVLDGERMKGEWLLIRLKPRGKERRENWLLRKIDDAEAGATDTLVETASPASPPAGRWRRSPEAPNPNPPRERGGQRRRRQNRAPNARRAARPASGSLPIPPSTRHPGRQRPAGNRWLHEVNYDGYRVLIAIAGAKAEDLHAAPGSTGPTNSRHRRGCVQMPQARQRAGRRRAGRLQGRKA